MNPLSDPGGRGRCWEQGWGPLSTGLALLLGLAGGVLGLYTFFAQPFHHFSGPAPWAAIVYLSFGLGYPVAILFVVRRQWRRLAGLSAAMLVLDVLGMASFGGFFLEATLLLLLSAEVSWIAERLHS